MNKVDVVCRKLMDTIIESAWSKTFPDRFCIMCRELQVPEYMGDTYRVWEIKSLPSKPDPGYTYPRTEWVYANKETGAWYSVREIDKN